MKAGQRLVFFVILLGALGGCAYFVPRSVAWAFTPLFAVIFGVFGEMWRIRMISFDNEVERSIFLDTLIPLFVAVGFALNLLKRVNAHGYEEAIRGNSAAFVWPAMIAIFVTRLVLDRRQFPQ